MLRPRPLPPPVISARLPCNRPFSNMPLRCRRTRADAANRWRLPSVRLPPTIVVQENPRPLSRRRCGFEQRAETVVSESGNIVAATAARIFADLADPQTVNRATDTRWQEPL